jgi:hypothetical protein
VNYLRDAIKAFTEKRDWEQFHSPKNLAMALSVEVSEVVEHFQWPMQVLLIPPSFGELASPEARSPRRPHTGSLVSGNPVGWKGRIFLRKETTP